MENFQKTIFRINFLFYLQSHPPHLFIAPNPDLSNSAGNNLGIIETHNQRVFRKPAFMEESLSDFSAKIFD